MWTNCESLIISPSFNYNSKLKKCRITKFNTNIKFKLNARWIKYVDIKKLL